MGRSFEEWLKSFKNIVLEGYEISRMDKQLAFWIMEETEPCTVFQKMCSPATLSFSSLQTVSQESLTPEYQSATVYQLGVKTSIQPWSSSPETFFLDGWLRQKGVSIGLKESWVIIKGLSENSGEEISTSAVGQLDVSDLEMAISGVFNNGFNPNIILVGPQVKNKQISSFQGFIPFWQLSNQEKNRLTRYCGVFQGISVLWHPWVTSEVLVFDNSVSVLSKTSLRMDFDDIQRPKVLTIDMRCSSVPQCNKGVFKIKLE